MLAARLRLLVFDVTDVGRPVTMYAGPLAAMPATAVGTLAAGRGRDFLFVAELSSTGSDNPLQGASLAAGFTWTATAATPAVKPKPTPPRPPAGTPTPPPASTPGSAHECPARKVRIRVRTHGRHVRRITVRVGHKRPHRAKLRHGRVTVKVKGHKRVKIKVTVKLAGGGHMTIHRRARGRRC
jgi:hypothetical protein